ncbi:aspartyl protease family protein [Aquimarina amphilecti]|nr:aspartyl protease family protein [Aquimarina amphilecti]
MIKKIFIIMGVLVVCLTVFVFFFINHYKKLDQLTIKRTSEVNSIPFRYSSSGHILIDLNIDNSGKTYPFILDTGASNYLFHNFPTKNIGKSIGKGISKDTNGKISFPKIYTIPFLKIGDTELEDIAFSISTTKFNCSEEIYGIIGKNIMRHFVWQIDFQNKIIHIAKDIKYLSKNKEKEIKIKLQENKFSHHLYIPLYIESNLKTKIILDTGLGGNMSLSPKEIDKLTSTKEKRNILGEGSRGLGGKSDSKQYLLHFNSLFLGKNKELPISDISVKVSEKSSFKAIGVGVLKNFLVTIDWTNKMLTLVQKTKTMNFAETGFGIRFGFEQELYIRSIIEGSKAHSIGLKPYMKEFLINGKSIETVEQFCSFNAIKDTLNNMEIKFTKSEKVYYLNK